MTLTYSRSFYNRSKEPWNEEEIEQIKSLYNKEQLSIIEIANIHKRTPGTISYQLKKHNIFEKNTDARGYVDYRNSALYAEIVAENPKNIKKQKDVEKEQPKLTRKQIQAGILQEIQEIKVLIQHIMDILPDTKTNREDLQQA
jgi:IS30 family transposase